MTSAGFPHSGTAGSKHVCCSPTRFAAYCALHRPFAPRHPPYALCSLTKPVMCKGTKTKCPARSLKTTHAHSLQYSTDNERIVAPLAGAALWYYASAQSSRTPLRHTNGEDSFVFPARVNAICLSAPICLCPESGL